MTRDIAGQVSGAIRVLASTGNKSSVVEVPITLQCGPAQQVEPPALQGGAGLVSIEIFQGPPVFKADFESRRTYRPIPTTRPEDGSPAREPIPIIGLKWEEERRRMHTAWLPDDEGFASALWRRQATVAIAIRHSNDVRIPEISAAIEMDGARTDLPEIHRETERDGDGFLTDMVFCIERTLYERGAELQMSVASEAEQVNERLALFGEEVPPLQMTWIPIILEDIPEEEPIDPEERIQEGVLTVWPVADYETGRGPAVVYQQTENDLRDDAPPLDYQEAIAQLLDHRLLHACGIQEIYYGVYNRYAMEEAGLIPQNTGIASWQEFVALSGVFPSRPMQRTPAIGATNTAL